MKNNTQIIADFLERHRASKGFSIYKVAELSGVSRTHAGRVFSGKTKPSGELFLFLCKALGVTQKEIFLLLSEVNFGEVKEAQAKFTVICPYQAEINGITEPCCNCSEDRQHECAMDI